MAKLVSKVYGDALFETAMEKELVDTFYEETSALLPILQANPELFSVLGNPQIVKEEGTLQKHCLSTHLSGVQAQKIFFPIY